MRRACLVALGAILGACGVSGGGGDAGGQDALPPVTYYGDVRPLLVEHCVSCHAPGGIAPFALDTYEAARPFGAAIAQATRDRIMPPFLADNSGSCQTFQTTRWLSDQELATFEAWHAMGEPMGDPGIAAPTPPPLTTLVGTISTISTGVDYAPDPALSDDYRCFVVDSPLAGNFAVAGYEVHPGNPRIVHHVIVYEPQSVAAADAARTRDAADPIPGYPCFGDARIDALPIVLWAPGGGATRFPRRTGLQVDGSLPLVIQIHYNSLAGAGMQDRTTVDLETSTTAAAAYLVPILDFGLVLPPGMSTVTTSSTQSLASLPVSVRVYGAFPHMHTLGRELQVDRIAADASETCLVRVPRWDFNWQLAYWYQTPIQVSPSDSIRISCTYDTTSRTTTTTWGEGTQDEMCLAFFYVSL